MVSLEAASDVLSRAPGMFSVVGDSIMVEQTPCYLGIYFQVKSVSLSLGVHITLGHWAGPPTRLLSDPEREVLVRRFSEMVVHAPMTFADCPPKDLGHRFLLTVHVQSRLHHGLYALRQWSMQKQKTCEKQFPRRVNFHLSADRVL